MTNKFKFIFLFSLFIFSLNLFIKPIYANKNDVRIKEALGFMIGGDAGWNSFATFYEVKGCNVPITNCFWE